jgi:formamidopyrimidine-DNA glycosylase
MPEGVEVKISAELIKPLVINKYVVQTNLGENGRYNYNVLKGLDEFTFLNRKIIDVACRGKFMYWTFEPHQAPHSSTPHYMFCTFGMTGQWSPIAGKHVCLQFALSDKEDCNSQNNYVYFNDPRHFGTIQFTGNEKDLTDKLNELGWDPLIYGMDSKWINQVANTLSRTKKPIGQVMMDQKVFAGVGNYIRAEALYLAKMSPWRQSNLLKKEEVVTLCQAIVNVMKESYAHQGATILTYKDAYGAEGKYSSCFKVYNQAKDPSGHPIITELTPEGRTIHWCPQIQL